MPTRSPMRLPEYDHARTGMYFVAVCSRGRSPLLGRVERDATHLSQFGRIVAREISNLEDRFDGIATDLAIVMPDHAHLILALRDQRRTLGTVVGSLKTTSAREVNRARGTTGAHVWPRGFYEHVVRNDVDLDRLREYITTNPIRWTLRHRPPDKNVRASREGDACASPLRG